MKEFAKRYQLYGAVLGVMAAFIAWHLRFILLTLFAAYVLASAFVAPVNWLTKRNVPRILAVLGLYFTTFALLIGLITFSTLPLVAEIRSFAGAFPNYVNQTLSFSESVGIDPSGIQEALGYVNEYALRATQGTISAVTGVVVAIVASIYLLIDWERIHRWMVGFSGKKNKRWSTEFFDRSEHTLGSWVRGQLVLSGAVGLASFVGLSLLGIPFALVLAIIAGIFELIPFIGPILAAVPAILIALNMSLTDALLVTGLYVLIQQAESHLLVPMVMRRAVKLHPVVIIFGVMVGYQAAGLGGLLLIVPLMSVAWVAILMLRGSRKHST